LNLCGLWEGFLDHNTIANFRKTIQSHFSGFRATVKLASHFELIGGSLVAGDSTKLRAQNSKKIISTPTNWTSYIDARLEEYNAALAKEDG
jgi:hypothetical protein